MNQKLLVGVWWCGASAVGMLSLDRKVELLDFRSCSIHVFYQIFPDVWRCFLFFSETFLQRLMPRGNCLKFIRSRCFSSQPAVEFYKSQHKRGCHVGAPRPHSSLWNAYKRRSSGPAGWMQRPSHCFPTIVSLLFHRVCAALSARDGCQITARPVSSWQRRTHTEENAHTPSPILKSHLQPSADRFCDLEGVGSRCCSLSWWSS